MKNNKQNIHHGNGRIFKKYVKTGRKRLCDHVNIILVLYKVRLSAYILFDEKRLLFIERINDLIKDKRNI